MPALDPKAANKKASAIRYRRTKRAMKLLTRLAAANDMNYDELIAAIDAGKCRVVLEWDKVVEVKD